MCNENRHDSKVISYSVQQQATHTHYHWCRARINPHTQPWGHRLRADLNLFSWKRKNAKANKLIGRSRWKLTYMRKLLRSGKVTKQDIDEYTLRRRGNTRHGEPKSTLSQQGHCWDTNENLGTVFWDSASSDTHTNTNTLLIYCSVIGDAEVDESIQRSVVDLSTSPRGSGWRCWMRCPHSLTEGRAIFP